MKLIDLTKITVICIVTQLVVFCDRPRNENVLFLEKKSFDLEQSSEITRIKGDAHTGNYFSRADSINIYGVGMTYNIPDSLIEKTIRVKINTWVRLGEIVSSKVYAFSLEDGKGKCINWVELDLKDYVTKSNTWVNVTDSVIFPGVLIDMPGMIIKMFSFNSSAKSTLDCDDLELSLYRITKKSIK